MHNNDLLNCYYKYNKLFLNLVLAMPAYELKVKSLELQNKNFKIKTELIKEILDLKR